MEKTTMNSQEQQVRNGKIHQSGWGAQILEPGADPAPSAHPRSPTNHSERPEEEGIISPTTTSI